MAELRFRYSFTKAVAMFAGSALFVAVASVILWGHLTNPAPNILVRFVARVGFWFFGVGLVLGLIYLLRSVKVVITISPDGFRDSRVVRGIIPWDVIIDASICKTQSRTYGVHLMLDPKFVPELHYNRLPGLRGVSDRMLTKNGLVIGALEINTDAETLLAAIKAHLH
jgi:hypothetical protein